MKKYLLVLVAILGLGAASAWAEPAMKMNPRMMAMLKHVNPMPNLMMTVKRHEQELDLSDAQKAALEKWHREGRPRMKKLIETVIDLEKQIERAALNGASGAVIQELATRLFNARGAIIKQKLACRNNMARVLGMDKMKKVIEFYKADKAARAKAGA